jgi:hypothetical protein
LFQPVAKRMALPRSEEVQDLQAIKVRPVDVQKAQVKCIGVDEGQRISSAGKGEGYSPAWISPCATHLTLHRGTLRLRSLGQSIGLIKPFIGIKGIFLSVAPADLEAGLTESRGQIRAIEDLLESRGKRTRLSRWYEVAVRVILNQLR